MNIKQITLLAIAFAVTISAYSRNYTESKYDVQYTDTLIDFGTGYKLRTEACMPFGVDNYPVVVMRSPYLPKQYSISQYLGKQAERYARNGIGFIVQHCRGKGGSEGQFEPNIYEREDGKAFIDWVDAQPWCSGIGLYGESYMALVWWIIGDILPDKVKGMYLHHYGVDRHLSTYNSGLFRQDILTGWAIDNATEPISKPSRDDKDHLYFASSKSMPTNRPIETISRRPISKPTSRAPFTW